ncbi:MAG: histidine kinase dimerization/phosphoacceptor domain-containing protein [Anaerolineae bacterium]|nr:histidine kinase dimerization/phosphoacceptor domain-containing protein [Anaerolineae bacterium]
MPQKSIDPEELARELDTHLTREGRRWLADLLHDHLGGRITNCSIQAEIILRAWDQKPDMAREEMQDLKTRLDESSRFLVTLVRLVTPPAEEQQPEE